MKLSRKNAARQRAIHKAISSGKALGGVLVGLAAVTAIRRPVGAALSSPVVAVEGCDADSEFVVRQLPLRQHMEQNVDVVGHHRVCIDLHTAEFRHPEYLVDNVSLVVIAEHHGLAHAARTDVVEALAIVF